MDDLAYFTELLVALRAISLEYQQIHWTRKGATNFYQDHLLAERLYNEVNDAIDGVAEKSIGVTGSIDAVRLPANLQGVLDVVGHVSCAEDGDDVWHVALELEQNLYDLLHEFDGATQHCGVKNLVEGLADDGTQRIYLVRRRLGV